MVSPRAENVQCLVKRPKTPIYKPPMHRSMFLDSVKREINAKKACHKTMGVADIKVDPKQFLRKNSRKVIKPFVEKTVPEECKKKPTVRPRYDYGVKDGKITATSAEKTKSKMNYVRMNIVDAIRKVPPLPKHRSQDTRNGHVIVLDQAGLEPTYVMKKDFGKTPAYIRKKYKAEEALRQAEQERLRSIKPPYRLLSDDERNDLLKGLKTNWAIKQQEFLLLPMVTDTERKIRIKTQMEKDLARLESDIAMLEKYKSTYVVNQDNNKVEQSDRVKSVTCNG